MGETGTRVVLSVVAIALLATGALTVGVLTYGHTLSDSRPPIEMNTEKDNA